MSTNVKPEPVNSRVLAESVNSAPAPPNSTLFSQSSSTSHISDVIPGTATQNPSTNQTHDDDCNDVTISKTNGSVEDEGGGGEPLDSESQRGIFGWDTVDDTSIPYLLRRGKKFVSVRIVECKLLSKYPNTMPDELAQKDPMVSHFITQAEADLLNEINITHCDYEYGQSSFTDKDLVVELGEFLEFFKIVKKNFPEEMLESMKSVKMPHPEMLRPAATPQSPPAPSDTIPAQYCGWVQINNTVSPYIIRHDSGQEAIKLVPLSVIIHAAGLLTTSRVEGLLPTIEECTMLNAACKAAGFDFMFGRNTLLIAIAEVIQRCQVQIFELPMTNPLQYAHYMDSQSSTSIKLPVPTQSILSARLQRPPMPFPNHMSQQSPNFQSLEVLAQNTVLQQNLPFLQRFPMHLPQGKPIPPQGMPGAPPNVVVSRNKNGSDSKMKPPNINVHTAFSDKQSYPIDQSSQNHRKMAPSPPVSMPPFPPMWNTMLPSPIPPMAHTHNKSAKSLPPPLTSISSSSPSPYLSLSSVPSSSYQPHTLPPSSHLHSNAGIPPGMVHPIFRLPNPDNPQQGKDKGLRPSGMSQGQRHPSHQMAQQSQPHSHFPVTANPSFGMNQFNSSLFTRTEPTPSSPMDMQSHHHNKKQQRPPSTSSSSSSHSHPSNRSHHNRSNVPNSPSSSSVNSFLNHTQKPPSNPPAQSQMPSSGSNSINNRSSSLSKNISACLVNGKSISCLNMSGSNRNGQFCLVEAVSKLYFPTVPIWEFVKVLQHVLKATLHECSPQEEAAFVQYYNLPVPKLKCNKMIMVDDLTKYFPQLNYIFSKSSPTTSPSIQPSMSSGLNASQDEGDMGFGVAIKRRHNGSASETMAMNQSQHGSVMPKLESVVQKLYQGKQSSEGGNRGMDEWVLSCLSYLPYYLLLYIYIPIWIWCKC